MRMIYNKAYFETSELERSTSEEIRHSIWTFVYIKGYLPQFYEVVIVVFALSNWKATC